MPTKPVAIILIGYRATGKTTVGKLLAGKLGYSFIDTDHAIEQDAGVSISAMVAQHGWNSFRAKEKDMLARLATKKDHVIATGGGAILHQDIWPQIKEHNLVIWLKADIATICSRLAGDAASPSQRPSLTGADIQQEVAGVLGERTPLYESSCHLSLDASAPVVDIVTDALHHIKKLTKKG